MRKNIILSLISCLIFLSGCGDSDGQKVFVLDGISLKGLENLKFNQEDCRTLYGEIQDAGYKGLYPPDKDRISSIISIDDIVVSPIGGAKVYFNCSGERKFESVVIQSEEILRSHEPFQRVREKLVDMWGDPSSEGDRIERGLLQSKNSPGTKVKYASWRANQTNLYELREEITGSQAYLEIMIKPIKVKS